ncbi:MAG: cell division protein FtsQ [Bacteroidia bacterium]|jgi:cell division protein FtsQ
MRFVDLVLIQARRPGGKNKPRKTPASNGATRKVKEKQSVRKPNAWLGRIFILLGAVAVIGVAAKGYLTLESIPVKRITVTGELEHTQAAAVKEMVQPAVREGFLRADLQVIRTQLEGLPWIYEATVRRRWPSSLDIHVIEQRPIARWGDKGFLNHEGGVFHTARTKDPAVLPMLAGPEGSARELMARYQRFVEVLSPLGLTVSELVLDERGELEVVLESGSRLLLGKGKFRERMQRFVTLYRVELATRMDTVQRVDLRYDTGAAVAFEESSQVAGI